MFKGIVSAIGNIVNIVKSMDQDQRFYIQSDIIEDLKIGDSIACSGVCFTVIDIIKPDIFIVSASEETLSVTNFGFITVGEKVNLELSLRVGDRIDGHFVQGHIDGLAKIQSILKILDSHKFCFYVDNKSLMKFIAQKGSVTLNGVSLTVNEVLDKEFTINVIPYTYSHTNFKNSKVGDFVNLEVDMIARYLDRLLNFNIKT